jgi:hypothetical protein
LEEHTSKKSEKLKRSNHVILVKNLPYSSSEDDLAAMFQKHGSLDKIILPPTRVFALVCFTFCWFFSTVCCHAGLILPSAAIHACTFFALRIAKLAS